LFVAVSDLFCRGYKMPEYIHCRRFVRVLFSLMLVFSMSISSDSYAEGTVDPATGLITPLDITGQLPYRGSAPAGGQELLCC
jgi:hypothetical protein